MKKLALAAGLALAVSSAASSAGGIQIAVEGDGDIGNSAFIFGIGNTGGNSLLDGAVSSVTGDSVAGAIWRGHNSFDVSAFTGFASEITIDFSMEVDVAIDGPSATSGTSISMSQTATAATFNIYYDDFGRLDSDVVAGVAASAALGGTTYTDGVLVASGIMSLGGAFAIDNDSGTASGDLSVNDSTQTITSSGGTTVGVDFTLGTLCPILGCVNTDYVVNNLTSAVIDMSASQSLTTPYDGVANFLPNQFSSATFSGGSVTPDFGADGENDFDCDITLNSTTQCDFQSQMNTTVFFVADRIPEPGTLALVGLGLAFAGRRTLRNK